MPTVLASCIGKRWSGPPGDEPPPTVTESGSCFHALTKSSMVLNGESAGTSTPSRSSIRRARGVASCILVSTPKEYSDPTTPRPAVIIVCSSPSEFISLVIATEPPAPTMFCTSKSPPVMLSSSMTATAARPVWS
jgi:hypothetical protein